MRRADERNSRNSVLRSPRLCGHEAFALLPWNTLRVSAFSLRTNEQLRSSSEKVVSMTSENPKVDPPPMSNTEKEPDDWVSGDEPMTGAQASYLKTLSEQLGDPDEFSQSLTKAEASKRIDVLKSRLEGAREKA
jgi:Protein of unknown function (DUF3072)